MPDQPWRVEIPDRIAKEILRLPAPWHVRAAERISSLAQNPRPAGCKKLSSGQYRLRVGNYRILYAIRGAERLVIVTRCRHRREAYR